jgi:hypothetical protein
MKKIVFITLSFCIIFSKANAQMHDTTLISNQYKVDSKSLSQKSKKQNTAAWLMLGGGAGMTLAGMVITAKDVGQEVAGLFVTALSLGTVIPEEPKKRATGSVITVAGAGAMLGSIPLFVASARNKRQSDVILKNETLFFNPLLNTKDSYLALGVKINL